ncbi:MAG TPA: protein kinase [Gemmatimonadales bacterium]|jgi:eukaryotic-like serine/threonine-protein kinase|nr:protein kinase [Gemmatimonadales bacterium]
MTISLDRLTIALADRYRLDRHLGQGGMATVYLAHDHRHDRLVAVKVLRPELAAVIGAERFLAEIKVTAHLQHPHILPLFDSGASDGFLYYVMPYVEGETLRDRLDRDRQLPIQEVVRLVRAVADALDYAHRHGVVHRDIKPENILVHEGQPLIADFGIALALTQANGSRLTETGLSLGTPHYMSPEQATGDRQIDGRSDIYALGAVAYELLAGEPPHDGPSAQAVIAKIVTEEPRRLRLLRASVPPHVEASIHKALAKLPADRFTTAGEFGDAIEHPGLVPLLERDAGGRRRSSALVAAVIGLGLVVGFSGGFFVWSRADRPPPLSRFEIGVPLRGGPLQLTALSPDGNALVFAGARDGQQALFLRRLGELTATPIPGTEGASNPVFSPDGTHLLFTRDGAVFHQDLSGDAAIALDSVNATAWIRWTDDGRILFSSPTGGIWGVPVGGGPVTRLFERDSAAGERILSLQDVLPGSRRALIIASLGQATGKAYSVDLRSGERRLLFEAESRGAWYAGEGALVYALADGTLWTAPFDPQQGVVTGPAVALGGPASAMPTGTARVSVSRSGSVVYVPRVGAELVLVDRGGAVTRLLDRTGEYHNPRFSPDGARIALDITDPTGRDVWVFDRAQGTLTRGTFENDGHDAIWSPGGSSLTYLASRNDGVAALLTRPDGGAPRLLASGFTPGDWLPDGRLVATLFIGGSGQYDVITVDSTGAVRPLVATPYAEAFPAVSPDGRWVAYVSDESRQRQVYVRRVDGSGPRTQVSVDGGAEPRWGPGGELTYIATGGPTPSLTSARLTLADAATVLRRVVLFSASDYEGSEPHSNYDLTREGSTFVFIRRRPSAGVILVQNVQQLLRADGR